jgi:hypothetical protein
MTRYRLVAWAIAACLPMPTEAEAATGLRNEPTRNELTPAETAALEGGDTALPEDPSTAEEAAPAEEAVPAEEAAPAEDAPPAEEEASAEEDSALDEAEAEEFEQDDED